LRVGNELKHAQSGLADIPRDPFADLDNIAIDY